MKKYIVTILQKSQWQEIFAEKKRKFVETNSKMKQELFIQKCKKKKKKKYSQIYT